MKKIFLLIFCCWCSIAATANVIESSSLMHCKIARESNIVLNKYDPGILIDEEVSEIAALEARMNVLLAQFHVYMSDSVKRTVFEQDLAPFIYLKAELACPTIKLDLYMDTFAKFEVGADINHKELQLAVGILTDVIAYLSVH